MAFEGWQGWDEYAAFYDWENRRTLGRRDVRFWQRLARQTRGRVLELGCGTGRVLLPLARTGVTSVGIDRSAAMLRIARRRLRKAGLAVSATLVRGDIRSLPFTARAPFALVIAPYGVVQSLLTDADLGAALQSAARVIEPGGRLGIDMVPDVPQWREYSGRVTHSGPAAGGAYLTLVESVRHDHARRLTSFDQEFRIRRPGRAPDLRKFTLTFRTLSVRQMSRRVERAGFEIEAILGDYDSGPWDERADVWLLVARRR
jgi:ubiquinone/menaquinone biosynthesis C-methylase UbiE